MSICVHQVVTKSFVIRAVFDTVFGEEVYGETNGHFVGVSDVVEILFEFFEVLFTKMTWDF